MKVTFTLKDKQADQFLPPNFQNIVWFTPEQLDQEIKQRVPLYRGDLPLSGHLIDEVAQAIMDALATKQVDAHVASEEECIVGESECAYKFAIDNLQINTRALELSGAPPEIAQEIETAAARGVKNQPYIRSTTNAAFTRIIRAACLKRGLLKPQISDIETKVLSQTGNEVAVAVVADVVPGATYKFEGQLWTGNQTFETPLLERSVHLYQHLPVDGAKLEEDLTRVQAEYTRAGFMHARIKPQPKFDDAAGTVTYDFMVQEGPRYTMGKFDMAGFPDRLTAELTPLWQLREGEPFDRAYIKKFFQDRQVNALLEGKSFVVEQSEGEHPNSLDVTIVLCAPGGCKASPDVLYMSRDQ
jgi:outer membrane protein insertion porin family